ncbi:hypothetical protein PGB90_007500 [Kerria lacca]
MSTLQNEKTFDDDVLTEVITFEHTKEDVKRLCEPFGTVEEVIMIRGPDALSRACCVQHSIERENASGNWKLGTSSSVWIPSFSSSEETQSLRVV